MAGRDNRQLLIYAGVFAAPLIVIQMLGGVVSSTEASTAGTVASPATNADGSTPFIKVSLTETEQAAHDYALTLANEPFGAFPFTFTAPQQPVTIPVGPSELDAQINAIMDSRSGPVALIDGEMVRVGDAVSGGHWIVESIDPDGRTVVFREQESGRLVTRVVAPIL